jgi:hypothetical protein
MAFFNSLYKQEGLERCKFQMDKSMKSFIKDKFSSSLNDSEVTEHYLFLTP